MKCAYVEWVDSVHMADWNEAASLAKAKPEVSCGILVEDAETHVTIALSYAPDTEQYGQVVSIPRVAIKLIQVFNKPQRKRNGSAAGQAAGVSADRATE